LFLYLINLAKSDNFFPLLIGTLPIFLPF